MRAFSRTSAMSSSRIRPATGRSLRRARVPGPGPPQLAGSVRPRLFRPFPWSRPRVVMRVTDCVSGRTHAARRSPTPRCPGHRRRRAHRRRLLLGANASGEPPGATAAGPSSPELSETSRLPDRRSLVVGDRAYAMSTADGALPGGGVAHPRRDGRGVDPADQARRRCLAPPGRPVAGRPRRGARPPAPPPAGATPARPTSRWAR